MERSPTRMYEVAISDEQDRVPIDENLLQNIAVDVLKHEEVKAAEISVALINGETMQRLNREHLGHDYDTDVLSFLLDCEGPTNATSGSPRGSGKTLDGEILISTDIAVRTAEEFGWSAENEVLLYLVHGLLHLVGYDDLTEPEQLTMRQREQFHLARWGLSPTYAGDVSPTDSKSPVTGSLVEPSSSVRG